MSRRCGIVKAVTGSAHVSSSGPHPAAVPTPEAPPFPGTGARQSSLRSTNLALVAQQVFSAREPISRADISAATGMTRSTASRLADELVSAGILMEHTPLPTHRPGRPAVPLTPAPGTIAALGLEAGVTYLAVRAIDLTGSILAERIARQDSTDSDPAAVLGELAEMTRRVLRDDTVRRARIIGAALALPGLVSGDRLLRAPNLGWADLRPVEYLRPALTTPSATGASTTASAAPPSSYPRGPQTVLLGNEADLAALTAARRRPAGPPGVGGADFVYLSGEEGIGAGLVRNGELWHGANGFAGEIGHVQVAANGPTCSCGNTGCLERFAGRQSILVAAGMAADAGPEQLLQAWHDDSSPSHVRARTALRAAAQALGIALGAAVNILDIPTIILGGQLAPLTEVLRPALEEDLARRVLGSRWSAPQILPAPDDEAPGATGGAWSLLEAVIVDPSAWI